MNPVGLANTVPEFQSEVGGGSIDALTSLVGDKVSALTEATANGGERSLALVPHELTDRLASPTADRFFACHAVTASAFNWRSGTMSNAIVGRGLIARGRMRTRHEFRRSS